MTPGDPLERSRTELAAARHLAEGNFTAQAISRAYYAAFYAAEVAVQALGETRSKHSGVIAAFVTLLVRSGAVEPQIGKLLRSLFDRRSAADHDWVDRPSAAVADAAIHDAEQVVGAVDRWLQRRA